MSAVSVVVFVATAAPKRLVLNSTLTDAAHSGGNVVLQVTLALGDEPPLTLTALTVTFSDVAMQSKGIMHKNMAVV